MPELKGGPGDDKLKANGSFSGDWYIYGFEGSDNLVGDFLSSNYIWGGIGDDTLKSGAFYDYLYGEDGNDILDAWIGSGASLYGGNGRDALTGSTDNSSYLDGGAGVDSMKGGAGGDVYIVDDANDGILENWIKTYDNELDPVDTVRAHSSFALAWDNRIERIETYDPDGYNQINLTGNSFDQTLSGNKGSNVLDGRGGNDVLVGNAGNDALIGGEGSDIAIYSGKASDYLLSFSGLNGELQVVDLRTGKNDGVDTLSFVEFLQFSDGLIAAPVNQSPSDIALVGSDVRENSSAGTVVGTLSSADPEGRPVTFSLVNDAGGLFAVSGNLLVATRAVDFETLKSASISIGVSDGINALTKDVEISVTDQNEAPTQLSLSNAIVSKTARVGQVIGTLDAIDPEGAALTYKIAGTSQKFLKVVGDKIVVAKALTGASDIVKLDVQAFDGVNVIRSFFNIDVTDKNLMIGTDAVNRLTGSKTADFIDAKGGNDVIFAGLGADDLHGGAGADRFIYKSVSDSGLLPASQDIIFDFNISERDRIDLTAIDANVNKIGNQSFVFLGTKNFSKVAGEVRVKKMVSDTYIYGDVNGDGKSDFILHLDDAMALKAGDFIL